MPTCCSAWNCSQRGGHLFPSALTDKDRRQKWIAAVNRKNFTPSKNSILCHLRFTEDDYIQETKNHGRFYSGYCWSINVSLQCFNDDNVK